MIVVSTRRAGTKDETTLDRSQFATGAEKFDQTFGRKPVRRARMKPRLGTEARDNRLAQRRNRVGASGFDHHLNNFVTVD